MQHHTVVNLLTMLSTIELTLIVNQTQVSNSLADEFMLVPIHVELINS